MARFPVLFALLAMASATFGLTGAAGVTIPAPGPVIQDQITPAPPPATDPPFGLRVGVEIAIGANGRSKYGSPPSNACYEIDSLCKLQSGWSSKIITYDSINTTAKLANYDVIVTGDDGYADNDFANYQDTLKKWVRNGGGLVTLGWAIHGIVNGGQKLQMDSVCAVKAIPSSYGYVTSGAVHITNGSHPITTGVSDFSVQAFGEYSSTLTDTWPGITRLGNYSAASNYNSIVCRSVLNGRSVYLGPIYFGSFGTYANRPYYSDANARLLLKQAIEWAGMSHDVGCTRVVAPSGSVDSGTSVAPACSVYNFGTQTETYKVRLHIGTYEDSATVSNHTPATRQYVTFADWTATARGSFNVSCSTEANPDASRSNDKATGTVTVNVKDVGVLSMAVPAADTYPKDTIISPKATWRNYGTQAATFEAWMILSDPTDARVYSRMVPVTAMAPGGSMQISAFGACTLRTGGNWTARCSSYLAGDAKPANDILDRAFYITGGGTPPPSGGWTLKKPIPDVPSGKQLKEGGWLAEENDYIYAAKGNKTPDFYRYDPVGDSWHRLADWPRGVENKGPGKGAAAAAGGDYVFATKGNNTPGFWKYDPQRDSWYQKRDVPLGISNKKVKGGTDLSYVKGTGHSEGYVYLLKGYKAEFYKYDVLGDSWHVLADAPHGSNLKWDKGSWLAQQRAPHGGPFLLYAHKAKYHEFYSYNTETDSWNPTALQAMPLVGSGGSRKAKDGSCAATLGDYIYAFKGANTIEFWQYNPETNAWAEKETIPSVAPGTTKKKKVKGGADLVNVGDYLYATKGNKTNQFWMYSTVAADPAPTESRSTQEAGLSGIRTWSFELAPNPLAGGFATVRLSSLASRLSPLALRVYDAQGRLVHSSFVISTSSFRLDLRSVPVGVYLVRLESGGFSATQKLVVQR